MKIFEKDTSGLLHEVPDSEGLRTYRRVRRVALGSIDVLLTAEEEAAEDAREAAEQEKQRVLDAVRQERAEKRKAALAKLEKLGLTEDDARLIVEG